MNSQEKERAKQVIVEIVRQAGGAFDNKTNLFKAFWLSHVHAIRDTGKALSHWPIVRMPRGPGIDNFDSLLGELLSDSMIATETESIGQNEAMRFRLTSRAQESDSIGISQAHRETIRSAAQAVMSMTASQASEWSHEKSRSWQSSRDGDELDIVLDSMTDDEIESRLTKSKMLMSKLNSALS
ncbi:MAG: type II toxin-antitoxin system antitoxin SocA domain-containing protein [Planctomycetales bacterium]